MILYNANLVTFWPSQPFVDGALVAVEGKSVVDFGKVGKLIDRYDDDETIDVGGRLIVPGMIDAHAELSRSLTPLGKLSARRIDHPLSEDAAYAGAAVALLDAVRAGVTTVFAFHSSRHPRGSAEALQRAFTDVGIRGSVAVAVSADADVEESIRENAAAVQDRSEMLRGLVGLEVSSTLGDESIRRCAESADELGARLHVSLPDAADELDQSLARWGATPIGRLGNLGVWNRRGFAVRAPHRLPSDDAMLRESGVWLIDCPQWGMMGHAPAPDLAYLRASRSRMATGTGRAEGGILEAFHLATLRQRGKGNELHDAIHLALWSTFVGSSEMATAHFGPSLGCLRPGARADMVVLDYAPSAPLQTANLAEHLFRAAAAPVHAVIVNGRLLYQNGRFTRLDEARIRALAREVAKKIQEHT